MRKQLRAAAMMVGMMAAGGAWAGDGEQADERRGERGGAAALPSPVAERLRGTFPDATIVAVGRSGSGWEASIVEGLRRQDLVLDTVGNIVERHATVAVRALDPGLRASLDRSHPRHTIWRATEIATDEGVFHEVLLARGESRSLVLFDPTGKALAGVRRT